MLYLATFYWGWLLASALFGLAMGWIAVVHRTHGVSKAMARGWPLWSAALVAACCCALSPAASATGSTSAWSCSLSISAVCRGLLAARLGGIARAAAGASRRSAKIPSRGRWSGRQMP